jgi:hypothetical protein
MGERAAEAWRKQDGVLPTLPCLTRGLRHWGVGNVLTIGGFGLSAPLHRFHKGANDEDDKTRTRQ